MGLRVPRSVLVMDRASLQRLRNYTKGVMERTICADEARYEQITELLFFRIDARIAAQNASAVRVPAPANGVAPASASARVSGPQPPVESVPVPIRALQNFIPRQTFVPRNVKSVECLVHLWRKGDASIGCPIALRKLQAAAMRKQLIRGYHNSWWVSLNHKDAMARYSLVIASIVAVKEDQINKFDEGLDQHWKEAVLLYHQKWALSGTLPSISALVKILRREH
jgi:hypothetical protein